MAIINNFPMEDSELTPIYENSDLFPALIKSNNNDGITIGKNIIWGSDSLENLYESYVASVSIFPLVTFYIKLTTSDSSHFPPQIFALDQGHVYRLNRRTNPEAYIKTGLMRFYKDEAIIYETEYPSKSNALFRWSLNSEDLA